MFTNPLHRSTAVLLSTLLWTAPLTNARAEDIGQKTQQFELGDPQLQVAKAASTDSNSSGDASVVSADPADQRFGEYLYRKPKWYTFITRLPGDLVDYGRATWRKESILPAVLIIGSTALLLWKDQYVVDGAHKAGDWLHISHTDDQRKLVNWHVFGAPVAFQGPFDTGSALYFIGDGWVDFSLAGGFALTGWATNSNRAVQTGSEIVESVLASGAVVQVLKHVTGRESPFVATASAGKWRPFPNQIDYANNVPHYDAYPSGHLTAGLATVTVMADNYPDQWWIRPVGYTALTVLSFQMLNNGVHWASDYPLAVALGYGFGKIAVRRGRRRASDDTAWKIQPAMMAGGAGLRASRKFGG